MENETQEKKPTDKSQRPGYLWDEELKKAAQKAKVVFEQIEQRYEPANSEK